jgi:hypothetical protein
MLRIVLATRLAYQYAIAVLGLAALSVFLGGRAIVIRLSSDHPDNRLPYAEICAIVTGVLGVVLLRPRMWEWDRVATRRTALVSACCALAGVLAPALVAATVALRLPEGVAWGWIVANAIVWSAFTFSIAPAVGPALAGGTTLVLYFVVGTLHNLAPAVVAPLPVTPFPGPDGHWLAGAVLAVVAAAIQARTRGATAWAQRMYARDE